MVLSDPGRLVQVTVLPSEMLRQLPYRLFRRGSVYPTTNLNGLFTQDNRTAAGLLPEGRILERIVCAP